MRVARIAAAVAASTASSQRNSRKARCDYERDRQGDAAHIASIRPRRREFNLVRSIGPTLDPLDEPRPGAGGGQAEAHRLGSELGEVAFAVGGHRTRSTWPIAGRR